MREYISSIEAEIQHLMAGTYRGPLWLQTKLGTLLTEELEAYNKERSLTVGMRLVGREIIPPSDATPGWPIFLLARCDKGSLFTLLERHKIRAALGDGNVITLQRSSQTT